MPLAQKFQKMTIFRPQKYHIFKVAKLRQKSSKLNFFFGRENINYNLSNAVGFTKIGLELAIWR